MDLQQVDLSGSGAIIARGHVDLEEFGRLAEQRYGCDGKMAYHGYAHILPGGYFGSRTEFDCWYQPAARPGRGVARITVVESDGGRTYEIRQSKDGA